MFSLLDPTCVFWDVAQNSWSSDGCRLVSTSDTATECQCQHLTNFAIIMDFNGNLDDANKVGPTMILFVFRLMIKFSSSTYSSVEVILIPMCIVHEVEGSLLHLWYAFF